jgi:hypothetical protein
MGEFSFRQQFGERLSKREEASRPAGDGGSPDRWLD